MLVRTRRSSSSPASRLAGDDDEAPPSTEEGSLLSFSRLPPPKSPPKRPRFSSFFSGLTSAAEAPTAKRDAPSMSLGGAEELEVVELKRVRGRGSGDGVLTLSAPPASDKGAASGEASAP
jgi:hypothetical protein